MNGSGDYHTTSTSSVTHDKLLIPKREPIELRSYESPIPSHSPFIHQHLSSSDIFNDLLYRNNNSNNHNSNKRRYENVDSAIMTGSIKKRQFATKNHSQNETPKDIGDELSFKNHSEHEMNSDNRSYPKILLNKLSNDSRTNEFITPSTSTMCIPRPATPSRYTAPVHIDVGGSIYTSSLKTLTRYPESRLSKLFNGHIPIVLDSLKQHYFIDRDGKLFRYILNYMRCGTLTIPEQFNELQALYEEAKYFELKELVTLIEEELNKKKPKIDHLSTFIHHQKFQHQKSTKQLSTTSTNSVEVISINISPENVENVKISGQMNLINDLFPEIQLSSSISLISPATHTYLEKNYFVRFPLNAFVELTALEIFQRLFEQNFSIIAATSANNLDCLPFSEYLLSRWKTSSTFSLPVYD
ncbi:unnamed protein product [Didymodactylos carnosus]|uniref:BTB domain-containing protein n=1 Tax=Didymodactylos carnosus TaxID=1234261 RepID=A0A813Q4P8_9BILA|nr:unnamed protein product [Didymodactylos carnosus]CAF0776124.1 unnamed protein product [Didymodactylos carnosus]CAF3542943.1 unnamed protein product [Didymodactylos carnosus]CAF3557324.1 unnamed protein product [Didymodactylos carnosus]